MAIMYRRNAFLLFPALILMLFMASGCVTNTGQDRGPRPPAFKQTGKLAKINTTKTNKELERLREKNFSVLRTEMALKGLSMNNPMLIRAFKTEMKLELWVQSSYKPQYELFRTYNICKKSGRLGPKLQEGDKQTPEGFYSVTPDRMNPNSQYFLSFNIGYPNEHDRQLGRTGSLLMIHGDCVSVGCLAMTNEQIAEIYLIVEQNFKYGHHSIPIHIYPFQMTDRNMLMRSKSPWYRFWQNLKVAYDYFEETRTPAVASYANGQYAFSGSRLY